MGSKKTNNLLQFENYLRKIVLMKEKYIPFYLLWVKKAYYKFKIKDNYLLSNEQIQQYIHDLTHAHPDWQVLQAGDALRQYIYFLTRQKNSINTATTPEHQDEWQKVIDQMRQALRLKHCSYQTEKSYTSWLENFRMYSTNNPLRSCGVPWLSE